MEYNTLNKVIALKNQFFSSTTINSNRNYNPKKRRRGWPHLGGDGMHSKNYQPDSFHPLVLHGLLYTFFADEYVNTYADK